MANSKPLYVELASLVVARENCLKSKNDEWRQRHEDRIVELVREHMPSGSGIDSGTHINLDESDGNKLVFATSFHHMNDGGMYDGWTDHKVTVRPSLAFDFELTITGRNRNEIKDYMADIFREALRAPVCQESLATEGTGQ